jgi:hypothetical protein
LFLSKIGADTLPWCPRYLKWQIASLIENTMTKTDEEQSASSANPGCILLLYNIFRQSLEDLADEKTRLNAEIWIFSEQQEGFSFLAICNLLKLTPGAVRLKVIYWLSLEPSDRRKLIKELFSKTYDNRPSLFERTKGLYIKKPVSTKWNGSNFFRRSKKTKGSDA